MDEASLNLLMSDSTESSTAAMYPRNEDLMTRALRSEAPLGIDDIVNLHRQNWASPSPVDASSSCTLATTVASSRKPSTATKPTSFGTTGYLLENHTGESKALATYASSLSATHGSGTEKEIETKERLDASLFGVGGWTVDGAPRILKGSTRARKRSRPIRRQRHKKPVVIIQQDTLEDASEEDNATATEEVPRQNGKDVKYLRQRRMKPHLDQLDLAEEGRMDDVAVLPSPPTTLPLTRARIYILIGLVIAIILTFSLLTFAAHHTGKARMKCTKGIIFAGTILLSCFTVLALIIARRTLQEALLAGVLEFLVGFSLVIEIQDFM